MQDARENSVENFVGGLSQISKTLPQAVCMRQQGSHVLKTLPAGSTSGQHVCHRKMFRDHGSTHPVWSNPHLQPCSQCLFSQCLVLLVSCA